MAKTVWRCAGVRMTSHVTMSRGNVNVHQGSPAAAVRRVSMILSCDSCKDRMNLSPNSVTVVRNVCSCHLTVVRTLSVILSPDSVTVVRTESLILSCDSCGD